MQFSDSAMLPIAIRDMISGVTVPVDLHVRLSENRYVVVAKAGTYTQIDRFMNFENKRVEFLYVRREDYRRFVAQTVTVATTVITETNLAATAKTTLLSQAASTVLSELRDLGVTIEAYEHARKVAESMLTVVEQNFNIVDMLNLLHQGSQVVFEHSVAVSMLSIMIAKSQGWVKKLTLEKVAMGGLLHDIGKKELPLELLNKPRALMDQSEIELYETHPYRGVQLLQSLTIVPDDVSAIVLEHHENAIGQGYPRRLKDVRMNPLARVVAVANCFADLTLANGSKPVLSAHEAIQHIEIGLGQPFNKESFRALKNIVAKGGASGKKAS